MTPSWSWLVSRLTLEAYLFEELGVEKISMAGVVIKLPAAVDTGEAAVVKEV